MVTTRFWGIGSERGSVRQDVAGHPSAREKPYALCPVSGKFPWRCRLKEFRRLCLPLTVSLFSVPVSVCLSVSLCISVSVFVCCFFFVLFFCVLFFAVPSTVPTSEALLPRRSSRHPSPPATPRAHSASRPRPQRSTGSDFRSLVGCHPKETLHCC